MFGVKKGGQTPILLIGLLLTPLSAFASESADPSFLVEAAQLYFQEGVNSRDTDPGKARQAFAQAALIYERLWSEAAIRNAEVARNVGNAYYLAGDLPHAILAYRRGLHFDPTNSELSQNLAYARQQVEFSATSDLGRPPVERWPPWLDRIVSVTFSVLALGLYSFGWLILTRWRMTRRRRLLRLGIAALLGGTVSVCLVAFVQWNIQSDGGYPIVVIRQDGVPLRTGNGVDYPPRCDTPLNRGVEGRLLFDRKDWLQIQLAGGEVGWVPRMAALIDEP